MFGGVLALDEVEVPISAIEHFSYCPRQCALIHVEQTYDENQFTIRGRIAHERVEAGEDTTDGDIRVYRSLTVWSERLGLRGVADVVEMRPAGPYPVEYKVGQRRGPHADLQLCAQALCLEEMLETSIPHGAIYYHAARRRHEVALDEPLRRRTIEIVNEIRIMLQGQILPPAVNDNRCPNCSLINACLPAVIADRHRLRGLQGALFHPLNPPDDVGTDPEVTLA